MLSPPDSAPAPEWGWVWGRGHWLLRRPLLPQGPASRLAEPQQPHLWAQTGTPGMCPLVRLAGRLSCSDQSGLRKSEENRRWGKTGEVETTQIQAPPLGAPIPRGTNTHLSHQWAGRVDGDPARMAETRSGHPMSSLLNPCMPVPIPLLKHPQWLPITFRTKPSTALQPSSPNLLPSAPMPRTQ